MRDDDVMDQDVRAALARANEIEAASAAKIDQLIARSRERDDAGRMTTAARTAQQALSSPTLTSTLATVTLKRSINPSLDRAIDEVQSAEIAYRTAVATVRALHARKELFEGARGTPRKRVIEDHDLAPEEWKFIREMRARKVPVSAIDQLTEPELDFVATLFVDKQKDMRHRERAGAWWTLIRAGSLDISSEAFNDEERAAILAARPADEASARLAYQALCEIAGRELDVPPAFAQFVLAYAESSSQSEPAGAFEKNVAGAHAQQKYADAEKLLERLGLPIGELQRAYRLMQSPALISFTDHVESARVAAEQRAAKHHALVDAHWLTARRALAEIHEAERQQERELLGADELGYFDKEKALERLGAYDDGQFLKNATIVRQVREGTFVADREKERRRTIDELAARLVDSPAARQKVVEMGIPLPVVDDLDLWSAAAKPTEPAVVNAGMATAPPPTLAPSAERPILITSERSAKELGLPSDVEPAAVEAYAKIAWELAIALGTWREATFAHGSADRNNPAEVASLRRSLEEADERLALDDICRRYLAIWRDRSLADADDYLVDIEARKLVVDVATGHDFEWHRKNAGFPRPSQSTW